MEQLIPDKNYLRELAFIFFSQLKIAAITAALIVLATLFVAFQVSPKYQASGAILVKGKTVAVSPGDLGGMQERPRDVTRTDLYSETEIMTSAAVIRAAAARAVDLPGQLDGVPLGLGREARIGYVSERIASRLETAIASSSNVINLTLRWGDPEAARTILDLLIREYLSFRRTLYNPAVVGDFLDEQVAHYRSALEAKEDEYLALVESVGTPSADIEIERNLTLLADLNGQLEAVNSEYNTLAAFIRTLQQRIESDSIQYFAFIENDTIRALGERLQEMVMVRARASMLGEGIGLGTSQSGADRSQMRDRIDALEADRQAALNNQVSVLRRQLEEEVVVFIRERRSRLEVLAQNMDRLESRINAIEARNMALKRVSVVGGRLEREQRLLAETLEVFEKRREEALLTRSNDAAGATALVVILRQASASREPVFPNKKRLIPLGFVAALLAGLTVGFLAHYFDRTIKRPQDVEDAADVTVFFSIDATAGWQVDGGAGALVPGAGLSALKESLDGDRWAWARPGWLRGPAAWRAAWAAPAAIALVIIGALIFRSADAAPRQDQAAQVAPLEVSG